MMLRIDRSPRVPFRASLGLAFLVGALAASGPASADVVSLTPIKDNTLYESLTGGLSNGVGIYLFTGRSNQVSGSRRRAVMAFDIAGNIPAGAVINSVTLRLNMSKTIAASSAVSLHRVSVGWGEGTSNAGSNEGDGASSTTNDATWLHTFFNTGFWTTPGGDFNPTASGAVIVAGNGPYTWSSTPQMVADVQAWLDTPAANFGWLLRGLETSQPTAKRFDSREHPTMANRPMITIDYTDPSVPTLRATWGSIKARYR